MTPEQLSSSIADVLVGLLDDGTVMLPDDLSRADAVGRVKVERARQEGHGDYASNLAMQLAKPIGTTPRELAALLAAGLGGREGVAGVEIAGPGFLNITIDAEAQGKIAGEIVAAGAAYGTSELYAGERVNLEFVSANPTGPLHIGGVRWAAVGDALGRILTAAGAEVTREYYFNDHGAQIDRFTRSLIASARNEPAPEDGYAGQYIEDIAARVVAARPDVLTLEEADAREAFREVGVELMFTEIKQSLHDFGVHFDVYFHEDDLHASGAVRRAVTRLTELGATYEKDGALWLRSSEHGDDQDRVIVRSNGTGAYLSGDLAYYLDKRERGFDRCVIMLGADHHGYVGRMMAMCAAFDDEPGANLEILIGQMVNLLRDGEPLRMSKRAGTVVTIDDLVEAVGVDAARYALARYSTDSTIDLDLDLWAKASSDNPVYYVQYAHARTCALARNAPDLGIEVSTPLAALAGSTTDSVGRAAARDERCVETAESDTTFDPSLLTHDKEGDLLRALAEFPRVVEQAARLREPHRVARYLEDTAAAYHRFYDNCRVLPMGDEEAGAIHRARLTLVAATRIVLNNGLTLLGVTAPERM